MRARYLTIDQYAIVALVAFGLSLQRGIHRELYSMVGIGVGARCRVVARTRHRSIARTSWSALLEGPGEDPSAAGGGSAFFPISRSPEDVAFVSVAIFILFVLVACQASGGRRCPALLPRLLACWGASLGSWCYHLVPLVPRASRHHRGVRRGCAQRAGQWPDPGAGGRVVRGDSDRLWLA